MNELLKKLFDFLLPYIIEFVRQLLEDYLGQNPKSYEKQVQFLDIMEYAADNAKDKGLGKRLKKACVHSASVLKVHKQKAGY